MSPHGLSKLPFAFDVSYVFSNDGFLVYHILGDQSNEDHHNSKRISFFFSQIDDVIFSSSSFWIHSGDDCGWGFHNGQPPRKL